jgi:hypothetical protein
MLANGTRLSFREDGSLDVKQKGQAAKIAVIDQKSPDRAQRYLEQRARGAYIASICQPEAAFDLSLAAQAQLPLDEDVVKLNKRLSWQIDNPSRGLRYVPLNIAAAKLIVFVDGSFANNRDLSSQIGFVHSPFIITLSYCNRKSTLGSKNLDFVSLSLFFITM